MGVNVRLRPLPFGGDDIWCKRATHTAANTDRSTPSNRFRGLSEGDCSVLSV